MRRALKLMLFKRLIQAARAASGLGTFAVTREIDAPAAEVWDILIDTQQWAHWGPSVSSVEATERRISAGAQGRVQVAGALWLSFEVTAWEPGAFWGWAVEGVPATGHRAEALGPDRCRLTFDVPTIAAPYAWVCRRAAERIATRAEANAKGTP